MKLVSMEGAAADLSRLVQEALDGEDVVITSDNEPLVRLVAVQSARRPRGLGWAKGQVTIAPDFAGSLDDFADHRWPRAS